MIKPNIKKIYSKILVICGVLFAAMPTVSAQFSGGDGTENSPYIITTAAQLTQLATYVNAGNATYNDKHYKLGNELDVSGTFSPIGVDNKPFKGFFDGNNKIITVNKFANEDYSGLFGYMKNGTIKNLGISVIENSYASLSIGGIVGYNDGGVVYNCYSVCYLCVNYPGGSNAGGIVGYNKSGTVSNCYSTATVTSDVILANAGGIVGYNEGGSVLNCYSTGSITSIGSSFPFNPATSCTGGVVGDNKNGTVSNCAALNPKLNCSSDNAKYFGRIVGRNSSGTLTNNIAFNNMINPDGGTTWNNTGANQIDGESITVQTINAEGTLGGRFTSANGWTTKDGKLPGLFGNEVSLPEHLRIPGFPYITTTNLPDGIVGTAYNQTLTASGNTPMWSLESGSLPTGLTLTAGGVILGVPSNSGVYRFTIKASNSVGFDTQDFMMYVFIQGCPLIITENLPNGTIGEVYQQTLSAISSTPVTWALEAGSLPAGLALSAEGTILGVPTVNVLATFTVKATNALGSDTKPLTINIGNVGISDPYTAETKSINIYPNPTHDKFVVELDGVVSVKLYDMFGKELLTQTVNGKGEININHLPKGVYNVSVLSEDKVIGNRKIVKQ